ALIDQVVEVDEELMAIYLEQGEELSPEQLHAPFEKALREGHLVPICFASARTGAGIPEFLEILARLAPNASESNPPPFLKSAGTEGEDPCLWIERNPTTHETVMRGLGDLHMRTKLEKMQQQYKMEVATKPPKIPYRETITKRAEGHCRHKKQTGGAGQFGEVFLKVEPLPRGTGFQFASEVKGGVIPTVFIPAVEKGVRQALDHGVVAGYPVEDLKVIVYDGKSHDVDSKEIAFVTAGRKAVIDAVRKLRGKPHPRSELSLASMTLPSPKGGGFSVDARSPAEHLSRKISGSLS